MRTSWNKKGAEKIISVYWFTVLFIVAAAVVYMTATFYGEPYDVRKIEANILANHVADCLAEGGYLKENVLKEDFKTNFLKNCGMTFDVEDYQGWNDDQYFVNVSIYNFKSESILTEILSGNINLKGYCNQEGKTLPVCIEKSFYALNKEGNPEYKITILSVVSKIEKNIN